MTQFESGDALWYQLGSVYSLGNHWKSCSKESPQMKRNPQVIMKNPSTLKSIFLNFVEFSLTAAAPGFVLSRQGAAGSHREAAQRKAAVRAAC